jgi:hypothetical protein
MGNPAPVSACAAFTVAAVVGLVHGGVSIYWGTGGAWLVDTLGENLVEQWQEHPAVLLPVGVVKILAALLPLLLLRTPGTPGKPVLWRRLLRAVSWAGGGTADPVGWGEHRHRQPGAVRDRGARRRLRP